MRRRAARPLPEEARFQALFGRALRLALGLPAALPLSCLAEPAPDPPAAGAPASDLSSEPIDVDPIDREASAGKRCAPHEFTPNPPDTCGDYMRLPCGLPKGVTPGSNCYLWLNDCRSICPGPHFNCRAVDESCVDGGVVKDSRGGVSIDCATCPGSAGRATHGLIVPQAPRAPSPYADYLARAAHLESASVLSFARLRRELASHGAPRCLLRAVRRARRDEERHAGSVGRLARRHGASPARPRVPRTAPRALEEIARENAVEGCVRETFGALVARLQAARCADPDLARALVRLAADEARHAALSWSIARWSHRRLPPEARARIAADCRAAIASLRAEAPCLAPPLIHVAGLPTRAEHLSLVATLESELWSPAGYGTAERPPISR